MSPAATPGVILSDAERQAAEVLIDLAIAEDLGERGDLTSAALIPDHAVGTVQVVSRQAGRLSGLSLAALICRRIDPRIKVQAQLADGDSLVPGSVAAVLTGPVRGLLTAERTVLNFLTLLSGVASLTQKFVEQVQGTRAVMLDTRKTLPGYRRLQKYAVRCGGGQNHRMGLYDAILIKDNHLASWAESGHRNLSDAILAARSTAPEGVTVEVEVDTLIQLQAVLPAQPDIVLLDNMSLEQLREAVAVRDEQAPPVKLEASGGVTLATVREIAQTGVDRISVGALTHSAPALDLGFDWSASR